MLLRILCSLSIICHLQTMMQIPIILLLVTKLRIKFFVIAVLGSYFLTFNNSLIVLINGTHHSLHTCRYRTRVVHMFPKHITRVRVSLSAPFCSNDSLPYYNWAQFLINLQSYIAPPAYHYAADAIDEHWDWALPAIRALFYLGL